MIIVDKNKDFANVFLSNLVVQLVEYTKINNYIIK